MPKRVLDGDALWRSDKLRNVSPTCKAEFANLIPLALSNGSFECSARLIWTRVYAYNREEVTVDQVEHILGELERAKMLFRWTDSKGKPWGFFPGIEKAGRLPPKSRKGHETVGAEPPMDALKQFLESDVQPAANHSVASGCLGFGLGLGLGSGLGMDSLQESMGESRPLEVPASDSTPESLHPLQYARKILENLELPDVKKNIETVGAAISSHSKRSGCSHAQAFEFIRAQALDAQERGDVINKFWFEDGAYGKNGENRQSRKTANGNRTSAAAERASGNLSAANTAIQIDRATRPGSDCDGADPSRSGM